MGKPHLRRTKAGDAVHSARPPGSEEGRGLELVPPARGNYDRGVTLAPRTVAPAIGGEHAEDTRAASHASGAVRQGAGDGTALPSVLRPRCAPADDYCLAEVFPRARSCRGSTHLR